MGETRPISAIQFSDLPTWGKVAAVVAAVAAVAAGLLLPRWVTMLGVAVVFLVGFVVLKACRKI
jgi:hypothetical protein